MNHWKRLISLVLLCSSQWLSAEEAQSTAAPPILETMTVVGTRTEKTVFDNPRSVSVVSQEEMRRASQDSLAEMLRDVPGLQLLDATAPGMKRVEIRGESSRRNVILIDGQEITDHSSYGTPLLIDPSAVERVEVLKGPSSVLYGSKAIGGVVNIITRTGADRAIEGEVGGTYFSGTDGYSVDGTLVGSLGNFDYRLSGSKSDHGDRKTPDGTLEGSSFEHESVSGHLGFSAGRHYFALKAEQYDLASEAYVYPSLITPPITEFDIDLPKRDRQKVGLFYDAHDLTGWLRKVHADVYHQTVDRLFVQDIGVSFGPVSRISHAESEDEGTTTGGTVQLDLNPLENHVLIAGFQYQDDNLAAEKTGTVTLLPFPGVPVTTVTGDDATIKTASLYAQDEWRLPADVSLLFGLRYYDVDATLNESTQSPDRSNEDQQLLGNIGLNYAGLENHVLRVHFSQGYVYPTLLQLFVDSPFGRGGQTFANPDLKPEKSDSIEIGWRYQSERIVLDSSAFYSEADDYIDRIPVPGGPDGTWENINEATTYGAEVFFEWHLGANGELVPYVNATWLRRKFETPAYSTWNTFTPELSGRLGVRWDFTRRGWADFYVRGATDADLEDETGITDSADAWQTINFASGFDFGDRQQLQLTLYLHNITDQSYQPPNELPGLGRSVELSARMVF